MWIYLVLIFSAGDPIAVPMHSMEECNNNIKIVEARKSSIVTLATCEITDGEWAQ